jgi:hypothetical protein
MKTKLVKRITSSLLFACALTSLIAAMTLGSAGIVQAQRPESPQARCDLHTLHGTYGLQIRGTRPVPPPQGGGTEDVIGVVIRTYDGRGNFTQIDNVKGSVTGWIPDRQGDGTYQVNPDCTAATQTMPGPGILIEERLVIVDAGKETYSMTANPPPLMVTSVGKRID